MTGSFVKAAMQCTQTWNGATSHSTTRNARVDLFFKAMRNADETELSCLLKDAWKENALDTLKLVAYIRDVRGGKGERKVGRFLMKTLCGLNEDGKKAILHNLSLFIGKYGRFDDFLALMNTPLEAEAISLLADLLKQDVELLEKGQVHSISLLAKWIPSEKKHADKCHLLTKKLCKALKINAATLRKMYLSPLRKQLDLLERHMCAKEWSLIAFNKVPSVAMHIHGRHGRAFSRHQPERFAEYKQHLSQGKSKVNASVLYPHQIAERYITRQYSAEDEPLLEAQWKVMQDKAQELGHLKKTLVMVDVSGSMFGTPMNVAISLGLLISAMAYPQWRDLILTFESAPKFHKITGTSLKQRIACLQGASWGGSTNLQAALDLILSVAKKNKIPQDEMPERLMVISDMQFDMATAGKTNLCALKTKFKKAGYEMPHIVFWNVQGLISDYPATSDTKNVSLISGYSLDLVKAVMEGQQVTPLTTMQRAISDARYNDITLPSTI